MNIKKAILIRVRLAFLVVSLFALVILYKIGRIQFVEKEQWTALAEENSIRYMKVAATRGHIFAEDGSILATSLPFYKVAIDATVASDILWNKHLDSLSMLLSRHFGDQSAAQYKRKLQAARSEGRQYYALNTRTVDYQTKKKMAEWPLIREGRLRGGVIFEKTTRRFHPYNQLAARTVGSVDETGNGVVGLEFSFNDYLSGKEGEALYQRIAGGNWKPLFDGNDIEPEDGLDIYTTLNINFQDVAEQALLETLKKHEAQYGTVVLMEVATGAIKAMTNLTRDSRGQYADRYNYALQNSSEPGSTFKIVSMAALLDHAKLSLKDTVHTGNGTHRFFDRVMRDSREGGYGVLTLQQVFEQSSNVGISKLVQRHFSAKPEVFISYADRFGFTKPLGFQMKGEATPYIKTPGKSDWYGTTLPWMSIGYESRVTPIQTLAAYNAIANNGYYVKPYIVREVVKGNKPVESFQPEVSAQPILSASTVRDLRAAMEGVVSNGTAKNLQSAFFSIAGKTGTAQIAFDRSGYRQDGKVTYQSSFVGYFPADNPQYTCIVVIGAPSSSGYYGNVVAGPVFRAIADKIFTESPDFRKTVPVQLAKNGEWPVIKAGYSSDILKVASLIDLNVNQAASVEPGPVKTLAGQSAIGFKAVRVSEDRMPDVSGMPLQDALYVLENLGITVKHQGKGRVARQSLPEGSAIRKGYTVTLELE